MSTSDFSLHAWTATVTFSGFSPIHSSQLSPACSAMHEAVTLPANTSRFDKA